MGSLFKPSTTVVQAPQQMSTSYEIPAYFKEAQEAAISRALASTIGTPTFDDQGKMTSMGTPVAYQAFTGQRIAPLSGYEQQAANVLSQQILPQAGQLGAIGAQTFDAATASQYMNPYQEQVISGTLSDLGEQYGMAQRALGARAIGAGAFGGSREGVERALGTERFIEQVGDVSGRLRQAGFESGAQRFAADRATQLGAAQAQLQGLAGAVTGLAGAGATERGIEQAGLAESYRDFIEQREYPNEQVRQIIGALSGAPIRSYGEERSGFVGTPVAGPSTFGQIAGAAGALAPFFSDRRLKEDINLIGQSPNGINIYSFKYKGDDKIYQGVMADEVPEASIVGDYGYLMVDYSKVDVEFKQLN